MANNQSHDTRTTVAEDRVAAAVSLSVAGVKGLTATERRYTYTRNFEGTPGVRTSEASDGFDGSAGRSFFSSTQAKSGTTSGELNLKVSDSNSGFGMWGGIFQMPNALAQGDEVFAKFSMYYPDGFIHDTTGGGGAVKFFRIYSSDGSGANAGYLDIYWRGSNSSHLYHFIKEGSGIVGPAKAFAPTATHSYLTGQWVTFNVYYYLHSDESQGVVRVWRDGELLLDVNTKTLNGPEHITSSAYLFTYWNGTVPQDQTCYTDEWTITSDRNQAEIDPATGLYWLGE